MKAYASHLRRRIMAHLRNALLLTWAGNERLALAARQFAALLRARLAILRAAA